MPRILRSLAPSLMLIFLAALTYYPHGHSRAVAAVRESFGPPPGLRCEVVQDSVSLTWQSVAGAKAYRIYHAEPKGGFSRIAEAESTSYQAALPAGALHRYAVSAVGTDGKESRRSNEARAIRLLRPWGLAVGKDGRRYVRDAACAQTVALRADGSAEGLMGPESFPFEGSFDLALDRSGRLLSAKWENRHDVRTGFIVQDSRLKPVLDCRFEEGSEPGRFRKPMGIGADSRGHIFVADSGNDRIQEFTQDGKLVQVIGAGELFQPMKVAFDSKDRLYVADSTKNRIAVFTMQPDGMYKLTGELKGRIKEPCYVAIDDKDRVFVSTNRVAGIYAYDTSGKQIWEYHGEPDRPLAGPRGLAFDGKGSLLVVDDALRCVWTVKLPE